MGIEKSIELQHALRSTILNRGERWRLLAYGNPSTETLKRYHYGRLTEILFILFNDDFRYRVEEFREQLKLFRSKRWKEFHVLVEEVFNERYSVRHMRTSTSYLTHKDISFSVSRYRQCQVCGCVFYCVENNGKTNVCDVGCRKVRDNAAERRRTNGEDGYQFDGQFSRLSPKSRAKLEAEMFLHYNPVADDEESEEWRFFEFVMSQSPQTQGFGDPQDIVCGTTTHQLHNNRYKSRTPVFRTKDTGGPTVYSVNIETGERMVSNSFTTFDKNILEIKEKLPKIPRNSL